MVDLDDFKKEWKEQSNIKMANTSDIRKAISKKSLNNIRWILIFSSIEFFIGTYFMIKTIFFEKRDYSHVLNYYWSGWQSIWIIENIIIFIGFSIFLLLFFYYYMKINVNSSVLKLTNQLIQFRKVGNAFIIFNVIMIIFGLPFHINDSINAYIDGVNEASNSKIRYTNEFLWIGFLFALIILILICLYYYIVYMKILKNIYKNQKELEELEL